MANGEVKGTGERRYTAPVKSSIKVNGVEREVQHSVIDGSAVFEGDIFLSRPNEAFGVAITGPGKRWPKKTVIFEIDPALPNPERVTKAIAHWQQKTFIQFKERTTEQNRVRFTPGDGCGSAVGMIGGVQFISLASGCSEGNVIHEIGHAVGLWHEQSREDRDTFVTLVIANIDPQALHNFDQHITDGDDIGAYDFGSIMHYPKNAFAIDLAKPTLIAVGGQEIGQRVGLSAGDIAAVTEIYKNV